MRAFLAGFFLLISPLALGSDGHAHHHGHLPVDGPQAPKVALDAQPDAMTGWNLHIRTENFRFAPERVNQAHRAGEGHAHVYVDGKKLARVYGPWLHIESLPPGRHVLRVTLNANTHDDLTVGGAPVEASIVLEQP